MYIGFLFINNLLIKREIASQGEQDYLIDSSLSTFAAVTIFMIFLKIMMLLLVTLYVEACLHTDGFVDWNDVASWLTFSQNDDYSDLIGESLCNESILLYEVMAIMYSTFNFSLILLLSMGWQTVYKGAELKIKKPDFLFLITLLVVSFYANLAS